MRSCAIRARAATSARRRSFKVRPYISILIGAGEEADDGSLDVVDFGEDAL